MDCAVIAQPYNHVSIIRRKTLWYTIASGNWTDKNIWMSNSRRKYAFPQTGDDVEIGFGHTVTCNTNVNINNLYIAGSLLFDATARQMSMAGDIQATGTVNLSSGGHSLYLYGVNNFITNFISGASSSVYYARVGDQYIMPLAYRHLLPTNPGIKYIQAGVTVAGNLTSSNSCYALLQADITVTGNVNAQSSSYIDFSTYNVTVNGTTSGGGGYLINSSSSTATYLFIGVMNNGLGTGINFPGAVKIECRGGISSASGCLMYLAGAAVTFTTNSQTIAGAGPIPISSVTVTGAITVTNTNTNATGVTTNSVNVGTGATFLNNANLTFISPTGFIGSGTFNHMNTAAAMISYNFNGDYVLPYTTYSTLQILGSGSKTVSGNLTVNTNLITASSLELSSFNLSVGGTTSISGATGINAGIFKSGSGNILFVGTVTLGSNYASYLSLPGNPDVELRGGINFSNNGLPVLSTGTGTFTFSTNNQSISNIFGIGASFTFDCNILISGAITLTNTASANTLTTIFKGTINGNNAASTFDNRQTVQYQNAQQPMLTGVLQVNAAANTFVYNAAGNQDVTGGTYRTLTLAGSGVKTLQGNVVVATLYTLTPPATLNTNGFTRS